MQDCKHQWTLRFPEMVGTDGPPEFIPLTMDFINNRGKLDYCKLKFSNRVADNIKENTQKGAMRMRRLAELLVDGVTVDYFMFDPNKVDFGEQYAHITLKDTQESLDEGNVDMQKSMAVLKDVYTEIFEIGDSDFLEDIKFTDGPKLTRETFTEGSALPEDMRDGHRWNAEDKGRESRGQEPINIVESKYVVDLENISPIEAIWNLNKKYGLSAWTDEDRNLWIGTPESSNVRHVCAPDDDRVWRWTNANIRSPRRPIKRVIVEGAWLGNPSWTRTTPNTPVLGFFDKEGEEGDERAIGIAERHDIEQGTEIVIADKSAKMDGIADLAHQHLLEETADAYQGQVRINPSLGGEFTPYTSVYPGDFLHIIPEDDNFDGPIQADTGKIGDEPDHAHEVCGRIVDNEIYTVTSVQHNVDDSGHWSISLDIQLYPEEMSHVDNGGQVHTKMMKKVPNEYTFDELDSDFGAHL